MSTLSDLYNTISGIYSAGTQTFAINSGNIAQFSGTGSANPIKSLLESAQWLSPNFLTMTAVALPSSPGPGASKIVLTGATTQMALPGAIPPATTANPQAVYAITAQFWIDQTGTPQLTLLLSMTPGWQLGNAFPWLLGNSLGDSSWGNCALVLASAPEGPYSTGLNFRAEISASDTVAWPLALFFNDLPSLVLAGPIVAASVSGQNTTMSFTTPTVTATIPIGSITLDLCISASANSNGQIPVPGLPGTFTSGLVTLSGAFDLEIDSDSVPVGLTGTFTSSGGPLTIAATLNQSLNNGLSDLSTLASGTVLSSIIPSQLPLGNDITLSSISLTLVQGFAGPPAITAMNIGISLGEGETWTLIPNILEIGSIGVTFGIANPFSGPHLSAGASASFTIAEQGPIQVAVSFPPITVAAGLGPNATINVLDFIKHFFGDSATSPDGESATTLVIDQLSLLAQPSTSTYSVQGGLSTDLSIKDIFPKASAKSLDITGVYFNISRTATVDAMAFGGTATVLGADLAFSASNAGTPTSPWVFSGALLGAVTLSTMVSDLLPDGWGLDLPDSLSDVDITSLNLNLTPAQSIYSISAAFDWPFKVDSDLSFDIQAAFSLASSRIGGTKKGKASYSGSISGQLDFNGLALMAAYDFHPNSSEVTFGFDNLEAVYTSSATDPTITIHFGNATLLQMVNFLLNLAVPRKRVHVSAPWDKLLNINLNGLTITVHLKTKEIDIQYMHNFDLEVINLTGFRLGYLREYGRGKVTLQLFGTFFGQSYTTNPLVWDVTNGAPPQMGNLGGSSVDINYLALGQHVSLTAAPSTTIEGVIGQMIAALKPPQDRGRNPLAQLPGLGFDGGSSWLIGAQFSLLKTVACSIVFNDPKLYGFLIELSGTKAKAFAGLKFEILYRKIADHLGVYHIELQFPPAMRQLQFGEVSITLPEIILDIYTNGDFKVDLGFPPNLTDFSQSFSVQVFPFVGFGGIYFGVLDGQASTSTPRATNGTFNPVVEFGIALSLGVGKTISVGPLSGGVLVTVLGELRGTLSWFHPTRTNQGTDLYYALTGTVAVVGKVYASVNFGIVSASANLTVFASVTVEIEAYDPILISMSAGVSVSVGIRVVFFTIHFHFSTTIHESFTIGHETTAPWITGTGSTPIGVSGTDSQVFHHNRVRGRVLPGRRNVRRLSRPCGPSDPMAFLTRSHPANRISRAVSKSRERFKGKSGSPQPPIPPKAPTTQTPLQLYATTIVTTALTGDLSLSAGGTGNAVPALNVMLVMESTGTAPATDTICSYLFDWITSGYVSADTLSAVSLLDLKLALEDADFVASTLSYANLSSVFANSLAISISAPPGGTTPLDASIFPMIPALTLSCGSVDTDFSSFTPVSPSEQQGFSTYTKLFSTPTANATNGPDDAPAPDGPSLSTASVMFSDYFTMVLRQLVRAGIEMFEKYPFAVTDPSTTSLSSIADSFPAYKKIYTCQAGDTLSVVAALFDLLPGTILNANPGLGEGPYAQGTLISIPVMNYTCQAGDTLLIVAARVGLLPGTILDANPGLGEGPYAQGTLISIPVMIYTSRAGDTLFTIATYVGLPPDMILNVNTGLGYGPYKPSTAVSIPVQVTPAAIMAANWSRPGLLDKKKTVSITNAAYVAQTTDTIHSIATAIAPKKAPSSAVDLIAKALVQEIATMAGILQSGLTLSGLSVSFETSAYDTLQSVQAYWNTDISAITPIAVGTTILLPASCGYATTKTTSAMNTLTAVASANSIATDQCAAFYLDILAHNVAIPVEAGQPVSSTNFSVTVEGDSFLLTYQTEANETLTSIVQTFSPDATGTILTNLIARIQAQNPGSAISGLSPTAVVPPGYAIKLSCPNTLQGLAAYLGTDLTTLWVTNFGKTHIFRGGTVLTLPTILATIAAGDTFQSLAARYNLSLQELCSAIQGQTGYFAESTSNQNTTIIVPNVPTLTTKQLTNGLQTGGAFETAVNMASRFFLHGLRLPNPADPAFATWIADGCPADGAGALATYPLYALSGQEFAAPSPLPTALSFSLTNSGGVSWLTFDKADPVSVPLSPEEITLLTDYQNKQFQYTNQWLTAEASHRWVPTQYPLRHVLPWHPATLPSALENAAQTSTALTIWPLPTTLQAFLAEKGSMDSTLPLEIAQASKRASGHTADISGINPVLFASLVNITIKKLALQPGSKTPPDGYAIAGISHADLQRILAAWTSTANSAFSLYLLYPPNASGSNASGYLSDVLDTAATFLLRSNLSTPTGEAQTTVSYQAAISDTANFLQLLFEAGSTHTGGYYLNYQTADGQKLLPDNIFTKGNEATISLLILPSSAPNTKTNGAFDFNNVAVVGQNLDPTQDNIFAQQPVRQVKAGDTLTGLAAAFGASMTVDGLAEANESITGLLRPGTTVANGTISYTVQPEDTISSVVARLSTPKVPITVSGFATSQASNGLLFLVGAFVQASSDQLSPKPILPPGTIGFQFCITDPTSGGTITSPTSQQRLDNLFSLLGYELDANDYFIASGEGLPSGPTTPPGFDSGTDPGGVAQTPLWFFDHNIHVASFALATSLPFSCAALPLPEHSPYAGTATDSVAKIAFTFQDIQGNQPNAATDPTLLSVPVLYTDDLITPDRWPSLARSYGFAPISDTAVLTVSLTTSPANYVASPSLDLDAAISAAAAAQMHYARIWYQLVQSDTSASLSTTLGTLASPLIGTSLDQEVKQALVDMAGAAYVMTTNAGSVSALVYTTASGSPADKLSSVASTYSLDVGTLAKANADLPLVELFGSSAAFTLPLFKTANPSLTASDFLLTGGKLPDLAVSNGSSPLAAGIALNLPTATTVTLAAGNTLSLSDLATTYNVAVTDGPPGSDKSTVPGLASANTTAPLTGDLTLTLTHAFPTGKSRILSVKTSSTVQTLSDAATAFETLITPTDQTCVISAADVAMANLHVKGIFAGGGTLTVSSVIVPKQATLAAFANSVTSGDDGSALLNANPYVFGVFETGAAILEGTSPYTLTLDDSFGSLADTNHLDVAQIAAQNQTLALEASQPLTIPLHSSLSAATQYSIYQVSGAETFNDIFALYPGWSLPGLATMNANVPGIFNPGSQISAGGSPVTATLEDSLSSLANSLSVAIPALMTAIAGTADLLRKGALIYAPQVSATGGQTFSKIAQTYWPGASASTQGLAQAADLWASMNATLSGLLTSGQPVTYQTAALTTGDQETLATLALCFNATLGLTSVTPGLIIAANPTLTVEALPLLSPAPPVVIAANATTALPAAHFPLGVDIQVSRTSSAVDPAFQGTRAETATTYVMPETGTSSDPAAASRRLAEFARNFEATFTNLKLATGPLPATAGSSSPMGRVLSSSSKAPSLWVVNFAPTSTVPGYSYAAQSGARFFALAPLTTTPWNKQGAEFPAYISGSGLTATVVKNISQGSPDLWAEQLFSLIDYVLLPQNVLSAQILAEEDLQKIISAKASLAELFSKRVADIFGNGPCKDKDTSCADAQQSVYQQMMIDLGSAYKIEAVVQVPFTTQQSSSADHLPRLFGKPSASLVNCGSDATIAALATTLNLSPTHVATVLQNQSFIVTPGISLTLNGTGAPYTTTTRDTFASIASAMSATVSEIADGSIAPINSGDSLLLALAPINAVVLDFATSATTTFSQAAAYFEATVSEVIEANWDTAGVFQAGSTVSFDGKSTIPSSISTPKSVASGLQLSQQAFTDAVLEADSLATGGAQTAYTLASSGTLEILKLVPEFDLSAAPLPLVSNGTSYANFLLSLKDASFQTSLILPLSYEINHMEVDVASTGIEGFYQSDSLNFIIPISASAPPGTGNVGVIGQTAIPVILRSFPSAGSLEHQSATEPTGSGETGLVTDWSYGITGRRPIAAQDVMSFSLVFNKTAIRQNSGSQSGTGFDAVFLDLAAVNVAFEDLKKDLAALGTENPDATVTTIALKSLAKLADTVVSDLSASTGTAPSVPALPTDGYNFTLTPIVSESALSEFSQLSIACLNSPKFFTNIVDENVSSAITTLDEQQVPAVVSQAIEQAGFGVSGQATVAVVTQGQTWSLIDPHAASPQTFEIDYLPGTSPAPDRLLIYRSILWPALPDITANLVQAGGTLFVPFTAPIGQIASIRLLFEHLSVLAQELAISELMVTRNSALVAGRQTNPLFVYFSGPVTAPNAVQPSVTSTAEIPIQGNTVGEALQSYLDDTLLLPLALAGNTQSKYIRLEASYRYPINGDILHMGPMAIFPIALSPAWSYAIGGSDQFPTDFGTLVDSSGSAAGVPPGHGYYRVGLKIMTNSGQQPGPTLLDLPNLSFMRY